ncbi:MAG: sortase [Parcubacteria group bacterium]
MKVSKRSRHITLGFLVLLTIGGIVIFALWRGSTEVIQTSNNAGTNLALNANVQPSPPRIPLGTGEPNHISIPDRGIETPVIYIDEISEPVFQEALTRGVVHYPGTAKPGEPGNPYIFGHSSDYFWKPGEYKKVFAPLVDIPLDTEVRVTNDKGELFIYKVIETKVVGPKEISVLDQYNNERTILTLQTSYPIGTALKRYIAVAELDEEATFGPAKQP